jgi:hypothetical protein
MRQRPQRFGCSTLAKYSNFVRRSHASLSLRHQNIVNARVTHSPAFLTFSNWRGQLFQFVCLHTHRVLALTHGLMARMQAPSAAVLGQQFAKFLDHDIKAEVAAVSKQVTASFNLVALRSTAEQLMQSKCTGSYKVDEGSCILVEI